MNIDNLLMPHIDNEYRLFHQKICDTKYEINGVKIPILRRISKTLLNNYDYDEITSSLNNAIYEHVMLKGLIIANINYDYEEKIKLIKEYIKEIDNWAICDIFVGELKFIRKHRGDFFAFIKQFQNSKNEFEQRFFIVCLLNYYLTDDYIDLVLNILLNIKSDKYYVLMAVAWCLSICLVKYYDKTVLFIKNNRCIFNTWAFNKGISKARESRRLNQEQKEFLKTLKIYKR